LGFPEESVVSVVVVVVSVVVADVIGLLVVITSPVFGSTVDVIPMLPYDSVICVAVSAALVAASS
jgi:hypothetical protein